MNVPLMLYIYLVSCLAMIAFNLVYMLTARSGGILHWNLLAFRERVGTCWSCGFTEADRKYFLRKLRFPAYIIYLEELLADLIKEDPQKSDVLLEHLASPLAELLCQCSEHSILRSGTYAYYIRMYPQLNMKRFPAVSEKLIQMLGSSDIYCRENALQALYALGNAHHVVRALRVLNRNPEPHNSMVLSQGLRKFSGSHEQLASELWDIFDEFKPNLQISIIKYIRACSDSFCPQMLELLTKDRTSTEVTVCAIRYLGEHPYRPAYSALLELASGGESISWEQEAEACISLCAYPGPSTAAVLKAALHSWNWTIRSNAAQSLAKLGLRYLDLLDILEGTDRYAAEILRYQLERENLAREAVNA